MTTEVWVVAFLVSRWRWLQNGWYSCRELTKEHTHIFILRMKIVKAFINLLDYIFSKGAGKTCSITIKLACNQLGENSHSKGTRIQQTQHTDLSDQARGTARFCRAKENELHPDGDNTHVWPTWCDSRVENKDSLELYVLIREISRQQDALLRI